MNTAKLTRALDATYLAALERAEAEAGRRSLDGGANLTAEGDLAITARPSHQGIEAHPDAQQPGPLVTRAHRLLLAKLAIHFEDIRTCSRPRKRREALAWALEDANPAEFDYVVSFAGICEALDLSPEWGPAALRFSRLSRRSFFDASASYLSEAVPPCRSTLG